GSLLDLLDTRNLGLYTPLNHMGPKEVYAELLKMQQEKQLLNVTTGKRLYKNMLIRALEVTTDRTTENVLSATVTLREVIITQTKSIKVADKADMKYGVETSAVINTGTKTPIPVNESIIGSVWGVVKRTLGG
ncbi:TPA: phage baseplate protein, partial [Klebsiella pneumoniae]